MGKSSPDGARRLSENETTSAGGCLRYSDREAADRRRFPLAAPLGRFCASHLAQNFRPIPRNQAACEVAVVTGAGGRGGRWSAQPLTVGHTFGYTSPHHLTGGANGFQGL